MSEVGFCSSYKEALRFEKNAANCVTPNILGEDIDSAVTTSLFAADKVEHNILATDGEGTFHGMGIDCMIALLTPSHKTIHAITRQIISDINIAEKVKVNISEFHLARHESRSRKFQKLPTFDVDRKIDILWELSFSFQLATPSWQGMMHTLH